MGMEPVDQRGRFEREVLPHLDAAYNLARWLLRNDQDAEDVTQEGLLRAYRHFAGFRGVNAKAWLLAIVRNACYGWIGQRNAGPQAVDAAELERLSAIDRLASPVDGDPERALAVKYDVELVRRCLDELPLDYRDVLVLREIEGLSYKEIGAIAEIPIGTVMSRLSRGRTLLLRRLTQQRRKESLRAV
jgi:RNA polymerase sigma-70 factor (ECF subfamily)